MKVLIIGASGLLAKPVIRHLENAGFQLCLYSRNVNRSMFDKDYEIIRGDVLNRDELAKALSGCDAVHISLAKVNEALAVNSIIDLARQKGTRLISYVSGCTVAMENRWFPMIDNKFRAEQSIISSGIPYMIFRPGWFFETLALMVRDGKAMILGKQPHPAHWVAADDFARMVTRAYQLDEAKNRIFFILGQESFTMRDLLEKYCRELHPEIRKVSHVPIGMLKVIAALTGNRELKDAASMFSYFEKVQERGNPDETNRLLGKPGITFEKWIQVKTRPN